MKTPTPPEQKRNSYRAYKRASFWQILLPMMVVLLIFVALSVVTSTQNTESLGKWAAISTVWLSLPMIVFLIVNLILLIALIYGMAKLLRITPVYTYKLTGYINLLGEKIASLADKVAEPVIKTKGVSASLRRIFRKK